MELQGLVFDIEEFAVFDGPGIRTAVFLKGCPLRCNWCHNPEGLQMHPQRVVSGMCRHCGACKQVCPTPDHCTGCGTCLNVCPAGCIRIAGAYWTPEQLAQKLRKNADLLTMNGGGITFSGGECSMQAEFVMAVRKLIPELHCAIETCGYCDSEKFRQLIGCMDLVIMDIKHTDSVLHKQYTGVSNEKIRANLEILKESGVPFIIRVPVIPGVNDSVENLEETARWVRGAEKLITVELLPYNRAAGAKYGGVGMEYVPTFDEQADPQLRTACFTKYGIPVKVM